MSSQIRLALLIPFLSVITIVVIAGGIGVALMVMDELYHEWGVIVLGMVLTVGVPTLAALLQRWVERE